jgi:membrane fusion protein (multidrug efflux system)
MADTTSTQATPAALGPTAKPQGRRKVLFAGLAVVVLLGAAGYGAWYVLVGSRQVSTDDAYVAAESALVTPSVHGSVREVRVSDTQTVRKGDVLVVIDDTDARLAVAEAEAALGQAERRVRAYLATGEALAAQVDARDADEDRIAAQVSAARSDVQRAQIDLERRRSLADSGSVSGEEVTNAQNALVAAQSALNASLASQAQARAGRAAAVGERNANAVLTLDATVSTNPEVAAARARLEQARVELSRTVVRAPIDGIVAKRQVQVGQRVQAGSPLMTVVPVQQAYVDANFKEVQLKDVRVGQPVELEADLYGGSVKYHGKVVGLAGGTGSAFAIVPAQNATGNWIKVVQRVPVRIALDPEELKDHPLRVGLSMKATIHTAG